MNDLTDSEPLPAYLFTRQDGSKDELFYAEPRFVTHIDDETIDAITGYYRDHLKPGDAVLALMSSWISHLTSEISFNRVAGLGMNEEKLAANPTLDDWIVHHLNEQPTTPMTTTASTAS
jgi:hypothetical protein